MKLSQNFFNEFDYYLTPSEMIEFLYCKRFIYFMKCLGIEQYEEKRYKVQKGREIHGKKEMENKDYLRNKIDVVEKHISVDLYSKEYKIKGKVDEVLTLKDGSLAPLDYKFSEYNDLVFTTSKIQMVMYSIMIAEMYKLQVNKSYLVYCRSNNLVKEIEITEKDIKIVKNDITEYEKVLNGYFPPATKSKAKCVDCCYRNICVR